MSARPRLPVPTSPPIAAPGEAACALVVVTPDRPEAEIARLRRLGAHGARFYTTAGAPQGWEDRAPSPPASPLSAGMRKCNSMARKCRSARPASSPGMC